MSNESASSRKRTRWVVIGLFVTFAAYVAVFTAINGIPEDKPTESAATVEHDDRPTSERPSTTSTETPTTIERPTTTTTAPRPSTTTTEAPTTTTTAPPAPVSDEYVLTDSDRETVFTTSLLVEDVFTDVPDSVLIEAGHAVCDAFDDGATFTDVLVIIASDPTMTARADEFGYLVGAAVGSFCERHMSLIP